MTWQGWLQSEACHEALLRAAGRVYLLCRRYAVPVSLLPCPQIVEISPRARRECLGELAHELWIFAHSQAAAWDRRQGLPAAAAQDPRLPVLHVAHRFVLHLRERARTIDVDPKKALYRRLRQILKQQADAQYRTSENGAFYSFEVDTPEEAHPEQACQEPYSEWPPPPMIGSMRELRKKRQLLAIARYFWEEVAARLGPRFLPVRELVRFIAAHFLLDDSPRIIPLDQPGPGESNTRRQETMEIADVANPDHALIARSLKELARDAVSGWSAKEKQVFYLTQGEEGGNLTTAAQVLGYGGPSGVSYVLRGLLTRLRDYCLLWPGLSPPDLDENLAADFIEEVTAICKSSL